MKMKIFILSFSSLFKSNKVLALFLFVCLSMTISAQTSDLSKNDFPELKLSSIRPSDQLDVVMDEVILANELVYNSTDTHPYDKVLFELYGVLLRDIKGRIANTGYDVIIVSYKKVVSEDILKPAFKTVNSDDLLHLAIGLVELLQDTPQIEIIQPK